MQQIKNLLYIAVTLIFVIHCALAQLTLIVSKDGRGNFTTITQAVAAAPNTSHQRTVIKIKAGVYYENINITQEKINLYFIGEGMDVTKISGNKSAGMGLKTKETATVQINANGFVAIDITFENTAGPQMFQAVALSNYGDHTAFYRCRFLGYQDTLNPQSHAQFYRDCEVYGTVDFIFGNEAKVVFQNCNIYARKPSAGQSNTITAQGKETPNQESGIVMQNCSFSGTPDLLKELNVKTFLGRPWKNYSTTVIMQSFLHKLIDPRGWLEWKGVSLDKVYNAEYSNRGPGASTRQRVNWSHVINSRAEAAKFTVRNFIDGENWIKSTGIPFFPDLL
ncbi:pectinesterase-like [Primulina eburnea]|uniref:pectinesterase-like n=1 Tax=Primulina eburnea TaxID=1245227 RepID=UPI003C6CC230